MSRPWKAPALLLAATALAAAGCSSGNETKASSPGLETVPTQVVTTPSTTTTTPPRTAGEPRSIVIIGDSISVGSEDEYHDALPLDDVEVVATSGIRLRGQREAIEDAIDQRPDVLVIELGTNDVPLMEDTLVGEIDEVLAETADLPCVRWVTVYAPNLEEEVAIVNDHLRRAVATQPNLDLVDWFAMVDEDPDLLSADGLHPDDGGQRALARAVAASTSSCA